MVPHGTSHFIDLDVHDPWPTEPEEELVLQPGMALTVEPGLYFPANDERVPVSLRGIGIQIEDTVLVSESGTEVLTAEAPKLRGDVEALRRQAYAASG